MNPLRGNPTMRLLISAPALQSSKSEALYPEERNLCHSSLVPLTNLLPTLPSSSLACFLTSPIYSLCLYHSVVLMDYQVVENEHFTGTNTVPLGSVPSLAVAQWFGFQACLMLQHPATAMAQCRTQLLLFCYAPYVVTNST